MSDKSKIEWTDATWNPVTGCTKVSEGCRHCWAARLAATRLKHNPRYAGLARITDGVPQWADEAALPVRLHADLLDQPKHWRKPRRIFVCSQADLFHGTVPWPFLAEVFNMMEATPQHTYLLLTKRPKVMMGFCYMLNRFRPTTFAFMDQWGFLTSTGHGSSLGRNDIPRNVCLGFSAETQKAFDERWKYVRPLAQVGWSTWASLEPLLGPIHLPDNFRKLACWVVAGGETGPRARPSHPEWFRSLRDQCYAVGLPFFFKQWGEWGPWSEMRDKGFHTGKQMQFQSVESGQCFRTMKRVGRKGAGRLLDGWEWNEFPKLTTEN